ncbi:MAG: hypothetical protein ACK5JP_00180 [Akkermansiaceae bacterium]|jgi:hypothetical protein
MNFKIIVIFLTLLGGITLNSFSQGEKDSVVQYINADQLRQKQVVIVGLLGSPIGTFLRIEAEHMTIGEVKNTSDDPHSAGRMQFVKVTGVNNQPLEKPVTISIDSLISDSAAAKIIKDSKKGERFQLAVYEVGFFDGNNILPHGLSVLPSGNLQFKTQIVVCGIGVRKGDQEQSKFLKSVEKALSELEKEPDANKITKDTYSFDSEDGRKNVLHRSEDRTFVSRIIYKREGIVDLIMIYRFDNKQNLSGCLIFNQEKKLLYKVGYGYKKDSGKLVAEEIWDCNVRWLDTRKIDHELPVQHTEYNLKSPFDPRRADITPCLGFDFFRLDTGLQITLIDFAKTEAGEKISPSVDDKPKVELQPK